MAALTTEATERILTEGGLAIVTQDHRRPGNPERFRGGDWGEVVAFAEYEYEGYP